MIDLASPQNALLANQAATNATTNLVGATWNAPANAMKVGQVWRGTLWFTFLHTAAATPLLTAELAVGGATVLQQSITPVSTAGTFHGKLECVFTVRSSGAAGSVMAAMALRAQGLMLANAGANPSVVDTTADAVDTTIARLIELRMRMQTAVASNTLTISQGYFERVRG